MYADDLETRALLAAAVLDKARAAELVDWAVARLERDEDTQPIRILAGLSRDGPAVDAVDWFRKAVASLGGNPADPGAALDGYARALVEAVADGTMDGREGVARLVTLYNDVTCCTRHEPALELYHFVTLDDALDHMHAGDDVYTALCPGLAPDTAAGFIRDEARLVLAFAELDVPHNLFRTAYCGGCGRRVVPEKHIEGPWYLRWWRIRRLVRKPVAATSYCPSCGGEDLTWLDTQAGRKRYLEEVG
jgi:hypothetical protein